MKRLCVQVLVDDLWGGDWIIRMLTFVRDQSIGEIHGLVTILVDVRNQGLVPRRKIGHRGVL